MCVCVCVRALFCFVLFVCLLDFAFGLNLLGLISCLFCCRCFRSCCLLFVFFFVCSVVFSFVGGVGVSFLLSLLLVCLCNLWV